MTFQRRAKPDIFEVLSVARRYVFVRSGAAEYLIVSALRQSLCLLHFQYGDSEVQRIQYIDQTAEQLGLFDGKAWGLPALVKWLESISRDKE